MNTKKILTSLLATVLLAGAMTVSALAQEEGTVSEWDGTSYSLDWLNAGDPEKNAGDKFYLNSAADLAGLAHYVNNYASTNNIFTGDTVYLNVDVDLKNYDWAPIGTGAPREKNRFYGSFDGQGNTISNLKVAEGHYYAGLFGQIATYDYSQTFSNVTINNVVAVAEDETTKNKEAAGALIGRANGTVIDNCHVTGEVYISGDRFVGGLLGHSYAQIEDCSVTATGTINADTWQAGGLVGSHGATAAYTASIENCVVDGGEGGLVVTSYYAAAGGAIGSVSVSGVDSTPVDGIIVSNVSVEAEDESFGDGVALVASGYIATNSVASNVETTVKGEPADASDAEATKAVADVDGVGYTDFVDALKAIESGSVVTLLDDITITDTWDCRYTGAKILVPVTINGNGKTLKFTGAVSDKNWETIFRFEANATVNDLTIDVSEATNVQRGLSSKGDITVDNFTFIGNGSSAKYGVIFGEGAGANIGNVTATITNSSFKDCSYGVSDNRNGQDAESVTVTGSTFDNAKVLLSAKETITFSNNEVSGGDVTITSYSPVTELAVTAKGNTLDETATNYINADVIDTDSTVFDLPVADIAGKKFISVAEAAKSVAAGEKATITVIDAVANENITIKGNVIIKSAEAATAATLAAEANAKTLTNVIFTVESGASLALDNFIINGLSYIYAKTPDALTVTNCAIDADTVEVSGTNCPPGFILFSSDNSGSVEFTFTGNTLLASPDETEDWYTYSHGIAGWNSIEKAVITGNTFGSAEAPLGAAAIKLMNFVEGATVDVSGNTFYVESKDSTWGPDAIQFYQNNSRGNNYTATVSGNAFYVDDATAAIGVNTNAMGKPVDYAGGATVEVATDNTVNGTPIDITDVLVFGNAINDGA